MIRLLGRWIDICQYLSKRQWPPFGARNFPKIIDRSFPCDESIAATYDCVMGYV
jgi:hypothetical protein